MTDTSRKTFRDLLQSPDLAFLMEAHDGISAKLAETAGFEALWASGLSISTMLGLRDCNEMAWSTLLGVVEQMVRSCSIPVIVDGDTGYGNFNTARRLSRSAEHLGAAGICFEDKQFPKMNSFYGTSHDLVSVGEFAGKLQACADGRTRSEFCLIARTETLISGGSVDEAVQRAISYYAAGADAVFVHSREQTFDQIAQVAAEIGTSLPLVIAPTTYSATPRKAFEASGISAVIWANQNMRAAVAAMQQVCMELRRGDNAASLATPLTPLSEVFDLLGYNELAQDELRYLQESDKNIAQLGAKW